MHRIDLTPIYVLHTRPYSNTSLIVEFFSKTYGRISAVARSARGPQSRYKGQCQLFTPMLAAWSGHHELKMLGNIELNGMPLQLNQKPLFCGFYFNELLMRLLHKEDPHPALFDIYHESLCRLEGSVSGSVSVSDQCEKKMDNSNNLAAILRRFEKKLLAELGYDLPLIYEAKSHVPINPTARYRYEPQHGFVLTDDIYDNAMIFLGADLIAIAAEKFDDTSVALSAKKLMRSALQFLLGNKPINSRVLF